MSASLLQEQSALWRGGNKIPVEQYVLRAGKDLSGDTEQLLDLIYNEMILRREDGQQPHLTEYVSRFPHLADSLERLFVVDEMFESRGTRADNGRTPTPEQSRYQTVDFTQKASTNGPGPQPEARRSTLPDVPSLPGYEIVEVLGRGGMGLVYKARQAALNRMVAVKVILAGGLAGEQDIARFRTEGKAVARFQHPHIVQIYDIGEHEGLPFFSLEYCAGGSLAKKIDGTPRDPMEAAQLVETLARAMHSAHLQNIIHRDLKPANILLSADGQPKISDFGLAKQLDDDSQTKSGAVMGTPSYMAPEQARGDTSNIGAHTDVYALGAILYELMTGRPPFKSSTSVDTILQVLHQEPVPPTQLQPKTPRDLETICLKCLQKAPERRYESALELAEDLRRFQAQEPITARPVGRWERARRWCRRNKLVAGLMAFVAVLLITGSAVGWYLAFEANVARNAADQAANEATISAKLASEREIEARNQTIKAEANRVKAFKESERANRVAGFLIGLFDSADPVGLTGYAFGADPKRGAKVSVKDILDQGTKQLRGELKDQPEVRAALLTTIGSVYRSMGMHKDAQPLLEEGLAIRRGLFGEDHPDVARSWYELGWLSHQDGELFKAQERYEKCLAILKGKAGVEDLNSRCRFNLAWVLAWNGRGDLAEPIFREVLKERRARLKDDHYEVFVAKGGLISILLQEDKGLEALTMLPGLVEGFQRHHGDESLATAVGMGQKAIGAMILRDYKTAEAGLLEAVKLAQKSLGENHAYVGWGYGILAETMMKAGRPKDAEKYYEQALEICRSGLGMAHPMALRGLRPYVNLLAKSGRYAEGCKAFEAAIVNQRTMRGDSHPIIAQTLEAYAEYASKHGQRELAESCLRRAVEMAGRFPPRAFPGYAGLVHKWVTVAGPDSVGKADEVLAAVARHVDEEPYGRVEALGHWAMTLFRLRRFGEMTTVLERAERLIQEGAKADKVGREQITHLRLSLPGLLRQEGVRHAKLVAAPATAGEAASWACLAAACAPPSPLADAPARPLRVGQPADGMLTHGDAFDPTNPLHLHQVFTLPMKKDYFYTLSLDSDAFDAFLRLENDRGDKIAEDDDSGAKTNARLRLTCSAGGVYRVIVTTFEPMETGKFLLTAREEFRKEDQLTAEDAPAPTRPKSFHKRYVMEFEAGKTYRLDLTSKAFDTYLIIADEAGKQLAYNDDLSTKVRDSRILFTPSAAGRYHVIVTSYNEKAVGPFVLSISP